MLVFKADFMQEFQSKVDFVENVGEMLIIEDSEVTLCSIVKIGYLSQM